MVIQGVDPLANYDQVIRLASLLSENSEGARKILNEAFENFDDEEFINILEVSREVLYDNTGDDELTQEVQRLIEFVYAEMSNRSVKKGFKTLGKLFKN